MATPREDPLRRQVEAALAGSAPPPAAQATRPWLVVVAGALGLSVLINLLVLFAPGVLGLAPSSDVDVLRDRIAALEQPVPDDGTTTALEAATARLERLERRVDVALPALCTALGGLGDWSWQTGARPEPLCPPAATAR